MDAYKISAWLLSLFQLLKSLVQPSQSNLGEKNVNTVTFYHFWTSKIKNISSAL